MMYDIYYSLTATYWVTYHRAVTVTSAVLLPPAVTCPQVLQRGVFQVPHTRQSHLCPPVRRLTPRHAQPDVDVTRR